jgi:hypothetical protein
MGRYQLEEFAPCMILLEKQQRGRRENEKGEAQWQPPIELKAPAQSIELAVRRVCLPAAHAGAGMSVSPSDELTVGWLRKAATVGLIPLGF